MKYQPNDDGIDFGPWRDTYEKQQRAIRKRELGKNRGTVGSTEDALGNSFDSQCLINDSHTQCLNDCLVDVNNQASGDCGVTVEIDVPVFALRRVPPHAARFGSSQHMLMPHVQTTISGSKYEKISPSRVSSPPVSLETPVVPSKSVKHEDNDVEASICNAMTSLSVEPSDEPSCSSIRSESPQPPRYNIPARLPGMTPGKRKKYYVVAIGKCTGVYDNWSYVQSLTSGVSGSSQVSYRNYDDALSSYLDLKERGLVRIVRMQGDETRFGPLCEAIQ